MKQKILAEIEELRKENEGKREACYNNPTAPYTDIKYYSGFFSAFDQIEELVNSLPEEPVRKDICNQCEAHNDKDKCDELVFGHNCPIVTTSEDLEEASGEYTSKVLERTNVLIGNQPVGEEIDAAFKAGVQWQKEHLWKPVDGDDLPEYEREVVVFTQIFPDDAEMMIVAIGHRPNPEGWDGKSLSTGKVEHYIPKTYDKGGWNIPNVKYWLDCSIPKEIEL